MSFDRYRSQSLCESILGCANFEEFINKPYTTVESLILDRNSAFSLSASLKQDAKDLYFKGCQSLTESLTSFNNRLYSWAIIKAYYATFYMIKADFALKDIALIRHKCIYYLQATEGSSPLTKGRTSSSYRSNYSGDHKSALNYYNDLFSNSDILLSQEIEGLSSYQWLMKKREQVNYQERNFKEPFFPDFLEYINSRVISGDFLQLIDEIINDNTYLLTFQPEYAPISIPYKRALQTQKNFQDNGIYEILSNDQSEHLLRFEPYCFR
ncbi:MAG: HEPN domain-containing protein [Bacteroidales bacterium]|nr:HEPN domain-containing protein [Bacteroidales bacterium]